MSDMSTEKAKAIESTLTQIERQFGKGSIMRLGQRDALGVESIPSGSLAVDYAIGIGGFPRGRVVEIFGPESSGKTTLALSVVAQSQRRGGAAAACARGAGALVATLRGAAVAVLALVVKQRSSARSTRASMAGAVSRITSDTSEMIRNFARSSIRFSRNDRLFDFARNVRLFNTSATS